MKRQGPGAGLRSHLRHAVMLAVFWGIGGTVLAQNTFQSAGDWHEPGNWSAGVPGAGETVTIAANCTLADATAWLADLTLEPGYTLTFESTNAKLRATNVLIQGSLTHLPDDTSTTTNALGVWIVDHWIYVECEDFTLAAGAEINVLGKGFYGALVSSGAGQGPGGGHGSSHPSTGGGYGGSGGRGRNSSLTAGTAGGTVYGDLAMPLFPGSGGGNGWGGFTLGGPGAGGGLVRIHATGHVEIDGIINAKGAQSIQWRDSSGGSGGGIYITSDTFGGSGRLMADGGRPRNDSLYGGGGGGGRIAVHFAPESQALAPASQVRFSVAGARGGIGDATYYGFDGADGTLYVTSGLGLPTVFDGSVRIHNVPIWNPSSLVISNTAHVQLVEPDVALTVGGDMLLSSTGRLSFATLRSFDIQGNAVLEDSAAWVVQAGATNSVYPEFGAELDIAGDLTIRSGAWLYLHSDNTNGGSAIIRLANLYVPDANAGINAVGRGWRGGRAKFDPGRGPGGGDCTNNGDIGGGGSYGGYGGRSSSGVQRTPYDVAISNAPVRPGSGGGAGWSEHVGGDGGGLVHIVASGTIQNDGVIDASGTNARPQRGGGGSGGGIHLRCRTFSGSGVLRANGGDATWSSVDLLGGGGGGGGRIAVWRVNHTFSGDVFVDPGASYPDSPQPATLGTIHWEQVPPMGTVMLIK